MTDAVDCSETGQTQNPFVVAVVLTWNEYEMAQTCIASLYENDYPNLKVVLVDNGSSFDTVTPLKTAFPNLTVVALDKNYGFTGGCNRGLERALDMSADYAFLLNNDTVVARSAVTELVKAMEERPEAGMASALLLNSGEEKEVFCHQCRIIRAKAATERTGENVPWTTEFQANVETEFAPAVAVMFRSAMLRDVGLFDESLFTNWEDWDLCVRIMDAGWKMLVVGRAEVVHLCHATTGGRSPFITYLGTRNRLICLFRHSSLSAILLNIPYILRSFMWQIRHYGWANWNCHCAFLKGLFHFLIGIRGKGGTPDDRRDS